MRLRFAEMLNPDGSIYVTNLRSAKATDTYTLKGGGTEVYEPSFTFHGFRYVEVTGYPGNAPSQEGRPYHRHRHWLQQPKESATSPAATRW